MGMFYALDAMRFLSVDHIDSPIKQNVMNSLDRTIRAKSLKTKANFKTLHIDDVIAVAVPKAENSIVIENDRTGL
jgi:hypothetical protein